MEAVWVALIVAVSAMAGPLLLVAANNRARAAAQREDWARQDAVAEKLLAANERSADLAVEGNQKLEVIHTLVNSNLTAAMQAELAATQTAAHVMRELAADRAARGAAPRPEDVERIRATEARVAELLAQVNDRAGPG